MLISEKENGESKTEESNDAAKDNMSSGEMHCSCILFFVYACWQHRDQWSSLFFFFRKSESSLTMICLGLDVG